MTAQSSAKQKRIYLDNNATTRPHPEVIDVVAWHLQNSYANPGSRHAPGRTARKALETARETIASILGADPTEVIFTSGGTEATNMALFGATQGAPGMILLTAGEHPATTESCRALERIGWNLHRLDVDCDGQLIPEQYNALPWADVRLVTLILAHNETGVIQDIRPLTKRCREHGPIFFHVDGVQAVGKIPVNFHALGVSSLALGAHKFHGPRGIGALLLHKDFQLKPFQYGGHQELGRRPGTEAVALAAGMAKALELWDQEQEKRTDRLMLMRDRLEEGLKEQCAPAIVNGANAPRLPNTLNLSFPGIDGDALLIALDLDGVACSLGSTCASGSSEPAPTLLAMHCPPEVYRSAVRFSLSIDNRMDGILEAIRRITAVVHHLRQTVGKPI